MSQMSSFKKKKTLIRALKDTLNWAVHRHIFYQDASDLRKKFEANRHD
ncbi:unnamed protein product [Rhodiola kirilowii]